MNWFLNSAPVPAEAEKKEKSDPKAQPRIYGAGHPILCAKCKAPAVECSCGQASLLPAKKAVEEKNQLAQPAPLAIEERTPPTQYIDKQAERAKEMEQMRKVLDHCHGVETYGEKDREICQRLSKHGVHLQAQDNLLLTYRDSGAIKNRMLENHAKAVAAWLDVCVSHLAQMMLYEFGDCTSDTFAKKLPLVPQEPDSHSDTEDS